MNITQNTQTVSYDKTFKYSLFFGWLGIDRFYMGDKRMGILKICLFFFLFIVPWLVDMVVIRSHKDDWEEWIGSKKEKRAAIEAIQNQQIETVQLQKDRESNGQCPKCGSSNLTAVSETTNKQSKLAATFQILDAKYIPNDKIVSTTKRVCLNCGNTF